ncbi:MAG: hypothetical protein LUB58_00905, partial [Oscillospiraceae bacterium]|nr:hypothetical protein [Oscillospiraceae bacterium]
ATIMGCFYGDSGEGDGRNAEEYTPTNADGITEAAAADFSGGYVAYVLETADGEHKGIWTMYTGDVADTDEDADADESESGTGSSGMESIETVLERLTEQTDAHPVLGEGSIYRIEVDEFSVRGGGGSDDADSQEFFSGRPLDTPGQYSGKWYAGTTTTYVYVSAGSSNVGGFFCNDLLAELWSQAEDDSQYITLVWSFTENGTRYSHTEILYNGDYFSYYRGINITDDLVLAATVSATLSDPQVEEEPEP